MKNIMTRPTLLLGLIRGRASARYGQLFGRFALVVSVAGVLVFTFIRTASAHIDTLVPNQWTAGGPGFTLRIIGKNIDQSDTERVLFNGTRVAATLIREGTDEEPGELQATIPASLIVRPDVVKVALAGFNSVDFTINPPPAISTASPLPDAVPGQSYSQRLEVSGGTAPFTWSGMLPADKGLSLDSEGLIGGTAIPVETAFEFQATVTDAATVRATKNFLIRIRYPCPPGLPCLLIEDVQVTEGDGSTVAAEFKVRLSSPSSIPVRVDYSTEDFTAASPADYIGGSGTLTFSSGVTLNSIVVTVKGDTVYEAPEQFYVNLSNPVNASIGRGQGVCTIADNDLSTFTICSDDVPKRAPNGTGRSVIAVNRDGMIDDVNVSIFIQGLFSQTRIDLVTRFDATHIGSATLSLRNQGSQLGSTCSPSPNCVFDDDSQTEIDSGSPPYIGAFRPFENFEPFRRKNARANWELSFSGSSFSQLNCWCLTFELPREGCRLSPDRAIRQIFFPHTVRAFLTSNGAPVAGQVVSFTVRGEHGELKKTEDVRSYDSGVAELFYYDFKPGKNFIEARAVINGVLSISKAEVTWVADGLSGFNIKGLCPAKASTPGTTGGKATLSAARGFRDNFLAKTPRGQRYAQLYYEFSTEAVQIMMFNPMLMLRAREILERYRPVIEEMTVGGPVTLTEGDVDEIGVFMKDFASKGSPELQGTIRGLCEDLRDPQLHAEFNITITEGPRREMSLPGSLRLMRWMGAMLSPIGLILFCFCYVKSFGREGAKIALKRLLCVTITFSVVSGQSGNPLAGRGSGQVKATTSPHSTAKPKKRNALQANEGYCKTALGFEANRGQLDSQVKFISRANGYNLYLTSTEAVMSLSKDQGSEVSGQGTNASNHTSMISTVAPGHRPPTPGVLRMKFVGANPDPRVSGFDELKSRANYFIGTDPTKWHADVPAYSKVKYENVYEGVDVVYYGNMQQLEYDFKLAPGADPATIRLGFEGADSVEIDDRGDLVMHFNDAEVRQRKPVAYQEVNGKRCAVSCGYRIRNQAVEFDVGPYDRSETLVIDPVLAYSTYLGGRGNDEGTAITVDSAGNAYVIGFTDSPNFPVANAAQPALGGGLQDVFVAKLDPTGTQLIYSTYIGGNGQDNGSAIAVDSSGNAFITGYTGSTNFPVVNAMQPAKSGRFNAFVAKLSPTGGLLYSTHLGGSLGDFGSSIAVDPAGNVYVAGVTTSANFPLAGAIQSTAGGAADVYVAKLNPSGNSLAYSTYIGGAGDDGATSLAVDSAGNAYVTGVTTSPNFRTANPLQAAHGGGLFDAFVTKLNPTGTQLLYSTYLGGSGEDRGFRVAIDAEGNAYVTGDTDSPNFPTANSLQRTYAGGVDAFVAKLNSSGTALTYSTYLGGSSIDGGTAIAVDSAGNAYVTGFTGSANFPTVAPLQPNLGGGSFDGFAAKLSPSGTTLSYSTYLGGGGIDSGFGTAADSSGNAYVMGVTDSINFPTMSPLQQTFGGGEADLFIVKIKSSLSINAAMVSGKKLFVTGSGFDQGAKILLNGEQQKTANDEQNPTTMLVARKAGKKIDRGQTVRLQVRNSDGALSNELIFTRPVQ